MEYWISSIVLTIDIRILSSIESRSSSIEYRSPNIVYRVSNYIKSRPWNIESRISNYRVPTIENQILSSIESRLLTFEYYWVSSPEHRLNIGLRTLSIKSRHYRISRPDYRVPTIEHRVSNYIESRLSNIEYQVSSPEHRILSVESRISNIAYWVPNIHYRVSRSRHLISSPEYRISSIKCLISDIWYLTVGTNMGNYAFYLFDLSPSVIHPSPSTRRNPGINMNRIPHIPCPSNPISFHCMNPMSHKSSGKRNHATRIVPELQLKAWHTHPSIRIIPHGCENIEAFGNR